VDDVYGAIMADDWEIVVPAPAGHYFAWAIEKMRVGYNLRRATWEQGWIVWQIGGRWYKSIDGRGSVTDYKCPYEDAVATDWQLAD
jgi:hypothetical protein